MIILFIQKNARKAILKDTYQSLLLLICTALDDQLCAL